MKFRTGIALVLLLALASLGFAQDEAGPPVPDGCIFERGVMTCVEEGPPYLTNGTLVLQPGDTFCSDDGTRWEVNVVTSLDAVHQRTTTEFYGVSHVVKSQNTIVVARNYTYDGPWEGAFTRLGSCW